MCVNKLSTCLLNKKYERAGVVYMLVFVYNKLLTKLSTGS